jgi:multisubunit Na+/H+ antiporter MnhF subunit
VNAWLVAATALLVGLVPCLVVCLRAPIMDAVVALEVAGTSVTLVLLVLTEGFDRPSYTVLPLVAAVLSFAGGLVFVRILERWL